LIVPKNEYERVFSAFQKIIRGEIQPVEYFENSVQTKNGELRTIAWHNALLFDDGGLITGTLSSGEDITERLQAERALRDSESRFRNIIEDLTEFVVRWKPDGTRTFVNDAYCNYLETTRDELLGEKFYSIVLEEDIHTIQEQLNKLTPSSPTATYENRLIRPDGRISWLQWIDRGIFDADGNLIEVQSVGRDITNRMLTENALRESEERFRSIVQASPMGMHLYQLEADDRLVFIGSNPAADNILWVDNSQFIGKTIEEAFPGLVDTEVPERYRQVAKTGEPWHTTQINYEDQWITGAYEVYAVQTSPGRMTAIFLDITERKQTLEEQERLANILESTSDIVGTVTASGKLIYLNKAGRKMFALEDADNFREFRNLDIHTIDEYLEIQPEGIRAARLYGVWSGETVITNSVGVEIPASIVLIAHRDEEGNAEQYSAVIRDISELRRAEDFIRLQSAALNTAANGIYITDDEGKIIWANPTISTITRYDLEEIIGQTHEMFSSGLQDELQRQNISEILSEGKIWHGELINKRKDGSTYISEQTITPVFDIDDNVTHYISIQQDITNRKENEQALEQHASQLALLNEVGEQIAAVLDLERLFQHAVQLVHNRFGYHHVGLFIIDDEEKKVVMRARAGGFDDLFPLEHELKIGQGMVGWTAENNQTLLSNDVSKEKRFTNLYPDILPTRSELCVPIHIGNKVFGVLDAQGPTINAFDGSDVTVMQTLADQIAIAVDNARLHEAVRAELNERKRTDAELQLRANQLSALNQMGQLVTSSLDIERVLEQVINVVPPLVNAEGVSILLKHTPEELVFAAASGESAENLQDVKIPADAGIAGQVLATGTPVLVSETGEQQHLYRDIEDVSGYHTQSLLAVPLFLGGEVIGVMEAVHSQPNAFSNVDLQIIEMAGAWASTSISNARQHAATERRLEETQAIATINQALNETLDLDRLLQLMVDTISRIIPHVERVIVHLYDETNAILTPAAAAGVTQGSQSPNLKMQAGEGIAGLVIKSGKPINVRDTERDQRFIPIEGAAYLRSLLVAPILSSEIILGTISVSSTKPDSFSDEDEHLLSMIGVQAALAIESARLFDKTQERARYLEMLNNITKVALQVSDSTELLQSIADRIAALFAADECYIALRAGMRQCAIPAVSFNFMRGEYHQLYIEPGEKTVTQTVLAQGHPLVIEDTKKSQAVSDRLQNQLPEHKVLLAIPLISGDQKLGAVHIGFNQPHSFTVEDLSFMGQVGGQIALAIAKVQLIEAEQNRRREAETLRDVTTTLTSTLEIDQVFNRILEQLRRAIAFDTASVFLLEHDNARIVAASGFPDEQEVIGTILGKEQTFFQEIRVSRTPIVIEDVQKTTEWVVIEGAEKIRCWMGIPLMTGDEVIGFLTVDSYTPGNYSQMDADLAQAFANQAAVAVQNARLYATTRRRLSETDTLFYISNLIVDSAEPDVESILHMVVNQLWQNFGYYHVHVYLIDQESGTLIASQGSGPIGAQLIEEGYQFTLEEGIVGYAASVGEAFMTNDVTDVLFFKPHPLLPDVSAELAAPLRVRNEILGVLDVQHHPPYSFDDADFRFLTTLADQIAVVLDKAMLYTQLQEALQKEQRVRAQLVQTAKLAAMGRLVASVAHELNNPLQAIQNALYLVKLEENLSEQAKEDLQVAIDEGTRMARLISRLRETYRPVAAAEYTPESIDVLVGEVQKIISTHLRHSNVDFEFSPDPDIPSAALIRDQIKQVILNLCINAIESMPEGGTLTIQSVYKEDLDEIHLKVSDTGPGLTPEVKSKIFEPFFTTKDGGTGLGLAVSFEIAQNHGGNIRAINNDGPGASFILSLPRARAMIE